jgi:hypothetical protein
MPASATERPPIRLIKQKKRLPSDFLKTGHCGSASKSLGRVTQTCVFIVRIGSSRDYMSAHKSFDKRRKPARAYSAGRSCCFALITAAQQRRPTIVAWSRMSKNYVVLRAFSG